MAVVPITTACVDAELQGSSARAVRIGQPVTLTSDLYGGGVRLQRLRQGPIRRCTGSAFLADPGAERVRQLDQDRPSAPPVRITLEPAELVQHPLRSGAVDESSRSTSRMRRNERGRAGPSSTARWNRPGGHGDHPRRRWSRVQVLDGTIANVSIPTIDGNLSVSPDQGTWVITSFAVSNGISVPLTGWLMGRYGGQDLCRFA